ncbi:hypothetical protein [Longimicrobium sp.]|uniref:hypothetical protein n=1 Tax=Longimicrobium sp. TaxID=2029185 RepID=UPI002EDADB4E
MCNPTPHTLAARLPDVNAETSRPDLAARVTPAAACETCGTMVAASTRTKDGALGYACTLCTEAANEIRRRFYIAESRKRMAMEEQIRRVVREVRSGTTDLPTFDQPDF